MTSMRAIALEKASGRPVLKDDHPEPVLHAPDQLLIRVLQVGICGTDRAIVRGEGGEPPPGDGYLVLGHEMLGEVVSAGNAAAADYEPGDLVVCTVRRSCGQPECPTCAHGESDMCYTGKYVERGIFHAHGYMTSRIVESTEYTVKLPEELRPFGVLMEPTTVVEKAILESVLVQHRLDWVRSLDDSSAIARDWRFVRRALVAGAGPIGMMAAFLLRHHDVETHVTDVVPEDGYKASLVNSIGARYWNVSKTPAAEIPSQVGNIDLIVEATGIAPVAYELLNALGVNGVLVFTGVPGDRGGEFQLQGGHLMRQQVLWNQIVMGSVNANRSYFVQAVKDLSEISRKWPDALARVITGHHPLEDYEVALTTQPKDEVKAVFDIPDV
ncbi:MAG: alcohol dehydrogenase [Chloroflexi bacterium]|nr:MAG: alcohol dehydrogenase [Chloroflexota bacterium]TMD53769.1 MAG: alcohol dehydrogenase [Chloroflexota bacterium]